MYVPDYREEAAFVRQSVGKSIPTIHRLVLSKFPGISAQESQTIIQSCIATQSILAEEVSLAGQRISEPLSFREWASNQVLEWRRYLPF